jgi:hypothetical protein
LRYPPNIKAQASQYARANSSIWSLDTYTFHHLYFRHLIHNVAPFIGAMDGETSNANDNDVSLHNHLLLFLGFAPCSAAIPFFFPLSVLTLLLVLTS